MPVLGEVTRVPHGYKTTPHVWHACLGCGKERWVPIRRGEAKNIRCRQCEGAHRRKDIDSPKLGDIYCGRTWEACTQCGKPRWVPHSKGVRRSALCRDCSWVVRRAVKPDNPKPGDVYKTQIWHACIDCGRERWVPLDANDVVKHPRCGSCAQWGRKPSNWKGGRFKNPEGYVQILLRPDDPMFCMARKNGYVAEHRLVVAQAIGRPLLPSEVVHHRDKIRDHNVIENLELMEKNSHLGLSLIEHRVGILEEKVSEQQKQISLLLWFIRQAAQPEDSEFTINVREAF